MTLSIPSQNCISNSNDVNQRYFQLKLFDCFNYKNDKNESLFCPLFCPMSILCPNQLAGKIQTLLVKEDSIVLGLGKNGICCCVVLCPLLPTGAFCGVCIANMILRNKVIKTYHIEESNLLECPIKLFQSPCNCIGYSLLYPCSLFQILVTIETFNRTEVIDK